MAVVKYASMMIGKPSWSKVQVQALIEFADLFESVSALLFLDEGSATSRSVVATSGSFGQFNDLTLVIGA
jgi:hypothetical protein